MSVGTDDIIDDAVTDAKLSLDSVYTVWRESLGVDNLSRILFKRNTISFDPSIIVSHNGSFRKTAVAASGNNVYVVYQESITDPPGNQEILYRRSINGGANFGSAVNLSNTTGNSGSPSIAASGNNVYVVWHDNTTQAGVVQFDILYKKSTNGGAGFSGAVNLSNTPQASTNPAIAASNNLT
jgi:hypothetical protein